jgi:Zn finger protein HypA/HybF involved in hydrogenase expression
MTNDHVKIIDDRELVIELLSGESYAGEANVRCPHCHGDYTHVRSVGTLMGSDPYEATPAYHGTVTSGQTASRRSAVEIVFECEMCPQPFSLVIQQHKGVNELQFMTASPWWRRLPELPTTGLQEE